jgi:hypothetical protein
VINWVVGHSRSGCLMRGALFGALLFLVDRAMERSGLTAANGFLMVVTVTGVLGNCAAALIPRQRSS